MAISIDTIYQRVLAVANKEQRGYLTPQEFNLLANQAQQDIFDQYFYDLSQFKKMPSDPTTPMSDMVELIKNKVKTEYRENIGKVKPKKLKRKTIRQNIRQRTGGY